MHNDTKVSRDTSKQQPQRTGSTAPLAPFADADYKHLLPTRECTAVTGNRQGSLNLAAHKRFAQEPHMSARVLLLLLCRA